MCITMWNKMGIFCNLDWRRYYTFCVQHPYIFQWHGNDILLQEKYYHKFNILQSFEELIFCIFSSHNKLFMKRSFITRLQNLLSLTILVIQLLISRILTSIWLKRLAKLIINTYQFMSKIASNMIVIWVSSKFCSTLFSGIKILLKSV